jgi:hypothetical protein
MEKDNYILGCFVSSTIGDKFGPIFRSYIYGENGLNNKLQILNFTTYGDDLKLALFQFYVNPIPYLSSELKPIEAYRKKEKSIGIPVIVNNDNFFSQSEEGRYAFLKKAILNKMGLLEVVVKEKKLDTNMSLLKADLEKVLNEF